ncbi:serine/threonine-protein kinase [Mycobacterium sp. 1274761.0]|uniref:serine/threonine-protein kinase n=1 Tax=Mycobacterium sp. 1274761.0 TaxID=1834077 RepID=UPI0007FC563B|nr:serine/threonine-protein kinase [Mycobacterium sp. 1274761.0]OBK77858.1 serine/threonine protein kinase [Mycobacterium sp. 1274761.0]
MKTRVGESFGKYKLNALLGKGGMGEVYRAYDTEKGRNVALKILPDQYSQDERYRARFLRESRAAAILQEPHVVPIHDWGEIDGNLYIDMRLVQGQTLHDLIEQGPLAPDRAVAIVEQIAAALDAAHSEGLIHRDVKPQNIIVTAADFAYLVDFGIAESQGETRLTMAGTQIGSFAYMAPERFNDEQSSPASDIYSLACVLYEALTGHLPFPAASYEHLIAAHVSAPVPKPSAVNKRVPAAIDAVIARGMAKHPDDRYGTAGALGRAAQRALRAGAEIASPDANTQLAQWISPLPRAIDTGDSGAFTQPAPTTTGELAVGTREPLVPIVIIGLIAALTLGAMGIVIGLLVSPKPDQDQGAMPTTATAQAPSTVTVQAPAPKPVTPTAQPTSAPRPPVAAPTPAVDTALQQLQQIAANDRYVVSSQAEGLWVPQLSSKKVGLQAEGRTWHNASILQEYLSLYQLYDAKLLWSGDWSVFDGSNWWITIAPRTYATADGALQWCREKGFDRDHCLAKFISTTHGPAGTTKLN